MGDRPRLCPRQVRQEFCGDRHQQTTAAQERKNTHFSHAEDVAEYRRLAKLGRYHPRKRHDRV